MSATSEKRSFDNQCWSVDGAQAPCMQACPIGTDASGYIMAVYSGDYDEAYRILSRTNPLPSVCGRVCHNPCEDSCSRMHVEKPLAIRALKRFAVERASEHVKNELPKVEEKKGRKVAVVGSGPAGLAVAYDLACKGYDVTVFERDNRVGGLLVSAIPSFVLPPEVLASDLKRIESLGVEFRTGTEIAGKEGVAKLLSDGYAAVLLAIGAAEAARLGGIPYANQNIRPGLGFIQEMIYNPQSKVSGKVVVIGGGNVATDAARLCVRRGADEVRIYAIEEKDAMPAFEMDKERSELEGVALCGGWGLAEIREEGGRLKLDFSKVKEIRKIEGRLMPVLDKEQTATCDANTLIVAVGQKIELASLQGLDARFSPSGTVAAESKALGTPGVFVAGDVVIYPGTVTDAMASGQQAAEVIDAYIRGVAPATTPRKRQAKIDKDILAMFPAKDRQAMPEIAVEMARSSAAEVETGFSEAAAKAEASRCINCAVCGNCIMVKHQMCQEAATRLSLL